MKSSLSEIKEMLNFTVGPVMSSPGVNEIAAISAPYFRTDEFSAVMNENESMILKLLNAPDKSRAVFLTASGTGAMESVVLNVLNRDDRVIVINGGSFGERFVELCRLHGNSFTEVKCGFGKQLKRNQLEGLEDHTVLLVNMHETSSGLLYDMKMVSDFCRENGILLVVDAISSFLADELDMSDLDAGVVIIGSQKALAVQPGLSMIALSPLALKRIQENDDKCMYLSLRRALKDGERGQTPFTPAVVAILQINHRLSQLLIWGGIQKNKNVLPAWRRTLEMA